MYLLRLDDASEHMELHKWRRMEQLLDKYGVKPIYGIIPCCQDPELIKYPMVENFWSLMKMWENKGWTPALHGCNHVFFTQDGGINPVHKKSEFAGLPLEEQYNKIQMGMEILIEHKIETSIFFAPAHTFDKNTMKALKKSSRINCINDTIANDMYYEDGLYFLPQQSGKCRKLPFRVTTFCYHPNIMMERDFEELDFFLQHNHIKFVAFSDIELKKRRRDCWDNLLRFLYFIRKEM